MAERWYVAQAQPGREGWAEENLVRQAFAVFLPRVVERARASPLFPGYLFVALDLAADDRRWQAINGSRGVSHLLPCGSERPLAVTSGYVEALQARVAAGEFDLRAAAEVSLGYAVGEAVPVLSGTMAGFTGAFCWQRKDRVQLLFSLLGRPTRVTVGLEHVAVKAISQRVR